MKALLRPFLALALLVSRWFGRRRARKLLALGLPRAGPLVAAALPGQGPALPLALRVAGPLAPPDDSREFWAVPTGALAIRSPGKAPARLLRLSSLPQPPVRLDRLVLARFRLDPSGRPSALARAPSPALARPLISTARLLADRLGARAALVPGESAYDLCVLRPAALLLDEGLRPPAEALALVARAAPAQVGPQLPDRSRRATPDLGAARPAAFGIDRFGRLPTGRDVPQTSSDCPPPDAPGRFLRPRTPLARAPLQRLRTRNFRLAPGTLRPANEEMAPPVRDWDVSWVSDTFKHDWLPDHFMAQDRWWRDGLRRTLAEWFALWWDGHKEKAARLPEAVAFAIPKEVEWAQEHLREQMLIRRDVVKDEEKPKAHPLHNAGASVPMIAWYDGETTDFKTLRPEVVWMEVAQVRAHELKPVREVAEATLQWRTLLDGLVER